MRGEIVRLQHLREKGPEAGTFSGDLRIDVEKQPAARVAEFLEVPDVKRAALAVERDPVLDMQRLAEQLERRHAAAPRVGGADQPFVADGTPMSEAENRLEVARQAKLFAGTVRPLRDVLVE